MMIDEEIKRAWAGISNVERIRIDRAVLLAELKTKLPEFDEKIRQRDWMEFGAAMLLIIFYTVSAIRLTSIGAKIGSGIAIIAVLYVVFKIIQSKRKKIIVNASASLKNYLLTYRQKVTIQIELLDNILRWYILPLCIGSYACLIGIMTGAGGSNLIRVIIGLVASFLTMPVFYFFNRWVYRLNKNAVQNQLIPLRESIDESLQQLESAE